LADDVRVTVTGVFATVTCVGGEVSVPLVAVLIAVTVIGFVPTGKEGTVKVAWPLTIGAVPRGVDPLKKVTGPLTPVGMGSVIVTGVLGGGLFEDTIGATRTGVGCVTVTTVGGDVSVPLVAVLIAVTVIGSVPTGKEGTVKVAWPLTIGAVPRGVDPLKKVTGPLTPVGIGSVIVTGVLGGGLFEDTIGATRTGVGCVTVTTVGAEVAGLLFASPEVVAVMGLVPTGKLETVIVATPPTMGAEPIGVVPLENVTVPVTPVGTVSVIVSGVFTGVLGAETTGGGMTGVALLTIWVRGTEVAGLLLVSPP